MTSDVSAAERFYSEVIGWRSADSGLPGMDYRILWSGEVSVGGLLAIPDRAARSGMHPLWVSYIHVPNVDESVASIESAGGAVHMAAMDVANVGRTAMVADPEGALFYVMTPNRPGVSTAFAPGKPGHGGWHELHARDCRSALTFYGNQFGWRMVHEMSMGSLGVYLRFNFGAGAGVGGMMNAGAAPRPYWLFYFNVASIDAASHSVRAHGGEVIVEPMQVPTGDWVIHARDPQGALFGLVARDRT